MLVVIPVFSPLGGGGGGVLSIMAYTGRLRPKGFRYLKGRDFTS